MSLRLRPLGLGCAHAGYGTVLRTQAGSPGERLRMPRASAGATPGTVLSPRETVPAYRWRSCGRRAAVV